MNPVFQSLLVSKERYDIKCVYVCMYVYDHLYIYVRIYFHDRKYVYMFMIFHAYMYVYMFIIVSTYICIYLHESCHPGFTSFRERYDVKCVYVRTYVYVHDHLCISVRIYVHDCKDIYMYMNPVIQGLAVTKERYVRY
jgi:hypothetical protein